MDMSLYLEGCLQTTDRQEVHEFTKKIPMIPGEVQQEKQVPRVDVEKNNQGPICTKK